MIRLKDAEKTYENGTKAVRGISFQIDDGEFVFLVGPSGSGKSTIIKMLTGEIGSRIPYVLELVGLKGKESNYPDELSGGEQQRVSVARALVNNPSTIVADEPTGNLDPARSLEIMTLLERINALGTTVIVVTHERGLVNHFNKRVIYLESGRVAGDATGTYEGVAQQ